MQAGRGNCVQREQLLHVHVLLLLLVVLLATMGQPTMIDATTMKATLIATATASATAAASAATERQPEAAVQPGSIKSICKYTLRHTHTHLHTTQQYLCLSLICTVCVRVNVYVGVLLVCL